MKTKFYWHIHHDMLLELLTEPILNRINYIKEHKDLEEIPLRLKLIKPVRGKLPDEVIEVAKACDRAAEVYSETDEFYGIEWDAYCRAEEVFLEVLKKHANEIEVLHEKECPNCSWNGETIFTRYSEYREWT